MARSWLIDGKTIASKVKNPTRTCASQINDHGVKHKCPNCHCFIDNTDEWPGLPAGVKFDPSDAELIEHLAAKCGIVGSKPNAFIDDFIPTVLEDGGICYTHPENLPGVRKDGSSSHFFHRTINAYGTGQRKRRKIYNEDGSNDGPVRWHKTGRTKHVIENGVHKGCKKIMVLYKSSKKGTKPDKSNWVMHQYHLGRDEDEKEGEYVVSKVFYQQQKHIDRAIDDVHVDVAESCDLLTFQTSPSTPIPNPPNPRRPRESDAFDLQSPFEEKEVIVGGSGSGVSAAKREYPAAWLGGKSQPQETSDFNAIDGSFLSNYMFDSSVILNGCVQNNAAYTGNNTNNNVRCGIEDLENLELDTPPYSLLPDLQISSQDSIFGWIFDGI